MSGDSRSSSSSMKITLNDMRESMEHEADLIVEYFLPGVSGEPRMCPRVGDQYQALIPDMVEGNECSKPNAMEVSKGVNELVAALSIPIMWVPNKSSDEENLKALRGQAQADPYAEESNVVLNSENSCTLNTPMKNVDRMKLDAASGKGNERVLAKEEKDLYPLPGTPDLPWSDFELDSFLLALYIFGKDLYLVKKIVETKKMNDVISYYYGPFYKCSKYQRWAKCLRSRSRKSIHGQRMFTGGRHQELFSRLNRHISVDTSNQLSEASKTFKEDGMSFEDYVFKLKDLVGTKLLIKVVSVGKGKQDLTGMSAEPLKLNRSVSVHREMQQDKGLSSLSCKEIIEQLTSSRLSKTKSNDLFWEAVWPRLLAAGWHSEQPKDQHHLVFLLPGVNRFKRTKHLKGKHYFDSVSDVLNRVASDPRMLELEDEKQENSGQEENGYLNLCNSDQRRTEMEFMIVDTSKHRGTRPVHNEEISSSSSACSGRDSSSEKSDEEVEKTQLRKSSKHGVDRESCVSIYSLMANGIRSSKKQKIDNADVKKRNSKKHRRFGGELKSGQSRYLCPRKRHVNAVGIDDKPIILCLPNRFKVNTQCRKGKDTLTSRLNSSMSVSVSSRSPLLSSSFKENFNETGSHFEQHRMDHAVIDLNIPVVSDDVETNHERHQPEQKQPPAMYQEHSELKMSGRRQSTRNRPLTTKALEAIESSSSSLIETKSKRKVTDSSSSRPCRRQRKSSITNLTSDGV